MLSDKSQSQKDKYCIITLYEESRIGKCIETEVKWWLPGAIGGGIGSCLMGIKFQFCGSDYKLYVYFRMALKSQNW